MLHKEAGNKSDVESLQRIINDFEVENPTALLYYGDVLLKN